MLRGTSENYLNGVAQCASVALGRRREKPWIGPGFMYGGFLLMQAVCRVGLSRVLMGLELSAAKRILIVEAPSEASFGRPNAPAISSPSTDDSANK